MKITEEHLCRVGQVADVTILTCATYFLYINDVKQAVAGLLIVVGLNSLQVLFEKKEQI